MKSPAPTASETLAPLAPGVRPTLVIEIDVHAARCTDYLIDALRLPRHDVRTSRNGMAIAIRARDGHHAARLLNVVRQHVGDELRDAYLSDRFVAAIRRHAD